MPPRVTSVGPVLHLPHSRWLNFRLCVIGHILAVIPQRIADRIYDLVARNRYRLFGRSDACSVPSPEVEQLFLP